MKPATPLPWEWLPDEGQFIVDSRKQIVAEVPCQGCPPENGAYIVHACNAYPRLVEALRELMLRCDGEEGVRADGSNIQTMRASALLLELGEL